MTFKVFYAWQSDRPNNLCRGLIKKALEKAVSDLNSDPVIDDAGREIEIDQDTQGVAGSPSIAETIFEKIRKCDVFVADLSFVPTGEGMRLVPNPNVTLEYGYALHALGDTRIIGVFNEAFGSTDFLPFDLRHKRWPIKYHADDSRDGELAQLQRKEAREGLTKKLTGAIRDVIRVVAENEKLEQQPKPVLQSMDGFVTGDSFSNPTMRLKYDPVGYVTEPFQYPWDRGAVGVLEDLDQNGEEQYVNLIDGPSFFLNLKSRTNQPRLSRVENIRIAQKALKPMAHNRSTGWSSAQVNKVPPSMWQDMRTRQLH